MAVSLLTQKHFFFLQACKEEWLLLSASRSRAVPVGPIEDDHLRAFKRKKIYNTQMRLLLRWFKREPEPQSLPVVVVLKLCGWWLSPKNCCVKRRFLRTQSCAAWKYGPVHTHVSIGTKS